MNTFSAGACVKFGWEHFKKNPWVLIGAVVVVGIATSIAQLFAPEGKELGALLIPGLIISIGISILVDMGATAFALKAHDDVENASITELWHPRPFWKYVGASLLSAIVVVAGLILLIVPGIMLAVMLMFVKFIVIDRGLAPVQALKESARITKGHRWELFGLFLLIIVVNIVGLLLLVVGLLVTIPMTMLALAHAYRELEHRASEVVAM